MKRYLVDENGFPAKECRRCAGRGRWGNGACNTCGGGGRMLVPGRPAQLRGEWVRLLAVEYPTRPAGLVRRPEDLRGMDGAEPELVDALIAARDEYARQACEAHEVNLVRKAAA